MDIRLYTSDFDQLQTPLLIIPVFSDDRKLPDGLSFLEPEIFPPLNELFTREKFDAKLNRKRFVHTRHPGYPLIVLLGAGKINEWDLEKARQWWGTTVGIARELELERFAIYWDESFPTPGDFSLFLPEMVAALHTAEYRVKDFLTEQEELPPEILEVFLLFPGASDGMEDLIRTGEHLGTSVNLARRLAEYPSNLMTPQKFTEQVKSLGSQFNWRLEILDGTEMATRGLQALLAVAAGSEHPPYLAIARYEHPDARKTVALVGKGVTFDTGGISIKPSKNMEEMKYDMAGAAAVLSALQAISLSGLPVNVVAAMPLVENMPSGKATRPGDVVRSYAGKTIEIINTDAEGRLILADALSYVEKNYQPDMMVDLATLTGSAVVALGRVSAAVLTNNPDLLDSLEEASTISGERIWRLPLWDEYKELMKSKIADIRNIATKPEAGTITAAIFLKNFVKDTPWAHLDIAGTAYNMPEKSYRPGGATGFGVRLLWHWVKILSQEG